MQVVGKAEPSAPEMVTPLALLLVALRLPAATRNSQSPLLSSGLVSPLTLPFSSWPVAPAAMRMPFRPFALTVFFSISSALGAPFPTSPRTWMPLPALPRDLSPAAFCLMTFGLAAVPPVTLMPSAPLA